MAEKWFNNRWVVLLLLTGAVYFFLEVIAPLTAPVLLALLFLTMFGPFLQRVQSRLKIHRQVGAVLLLLAGCILFGGLFWVLFSWGIGSLPEWTRGLTTVEEGLMELVRSVCGVAEKAGILDADYLEEMMKVRIQEGMNYLRMNFLPGLLTQSLEYVRLLAAAGGFLVTFLIATVLLAKDYDMFMNRMLDREDCHVFLEIICGIIRYLATFVKAQMVIIAVIGLAAAAVLWAIGIKHGILWGVLAGILDALPFIGTGIVLVPLAISRILAGKHWQAVICVILYIICIFIRESLEPRLIGKKAGIPPVAVLLSIYAGVQLFGIWGIIGGPLGFVIIWQGFRSLEKRRKSI